MSDGSELSTAMVPLIGIAGFFIILWVVGVIAGGMDFLESLATPLTGVFIIVSWVIYYYFQSTADDIPRGTG